MKSKFHIYVAIWMLILTMMTSFAAAVSEHQGELSAEDALKPPSEAMKIIDRMKFKPIDIKVPKVGVDVDRVVLDNGMILYLKEDNRFPVIDIKALIRTGEVYENHENYGTARLTGSVMRTGGTRNLTPEELNKELEYMAASISSSMGTWEGEVTLNVIKSQLDRGMELFSEVLRYPAFDEKEIDLAKSQIREELLRAADDTGRLGMRQYYRLLYPNYSIGWEYDWNVVRGIKQQDLVNWHKRFYMPNNMIFAVVGDFKKDELIEKFNHFFGDWPKGQANLSKTQSVENTYEPGVYYVEKDVSQAYIRMGHLGVRKGNPDKFALEMMQFILGGGGFGSLLTDRVRNDEGLAYSVGSYMNLDSPVFGTFHAVSFTRNDAAIRAASLMREQMKRMQNERMSADKIDWAKNSIINSFVFEFEEPYQQVVKLMALEYYDNPPETTLKMLIVILNLFQDLAFSLLVVPTISRHG
jgi:zinc protease